MSLIKEQEYAISGEKSEDNLDFILDLIDEYIELVENLN